MKHIIFGILVLFATVWGWDTVKDHFVSLRMEMEENASLPEEASAAIDEVWSVLVAANSYADVSPRPLGSFTLNLARRYRPAGFNTDKYLLYLTENRRVLLQNTFKHIFYTSQEWAALQKNAGYFIYSLRKIII